VVWLDDNWSRLTISLPDETKKTGDEDKRKSKQGRLRTFKKQVFSLTKHRVLKSFLNNRNYCEVECNKQKHF